MIDPMDVVVRDGMVSFWDLDNEPISVRSWAALMATPDKILARTKVNDKTVITAWLGMNDGKALPQGQVPTKNFGTMVHYGDDYGTEEFSPDRESALAVHERIVRALVQRNAGAPV